MISSLDQPARGARSAVIMGCGRIGASVAFALVERGYMVRAMDLDSASFDLLPSGTVESGQIVPVVGDGTLESDLRRASVPDANLFVAVAGGDSFNALAAQLAKHILQVPTVICQINDSTRSEMYSRLGLVTVSATKLVSGLVLEATKA